MLTTEQVAALVGIISAAIGSIMTLIFTKGAEAYVNVLRARAELRKQESDDLRPRFDELHLRVDELDRKVHECEMDRAALHVEVRMLRQKVDAKDGQQH